MENNNRLEMTLDVTGRATSYEFHGIESSPLVGVEWFAKTLEALGMAVTLDESDEEAVRLCVSFPDPYKAERLRNRGGGRPKAQATYHGELAKMITNRERLAWLTSHSVKDGMEALGVTSKRTYYRRVADIRAKVHAEDELIRRAAESANN